MNLRTTIFICILSLVHISCESPSLTYQTTEADLSILQTSGIETSGIETSGIETSGIETSGIETSGIEVDVNAPDEGPNDLDLSMSSDVGIQDLGLDSSLDQDLSCGELTQCPEGLSCVSNEQEEWCACPIGYYLNQEDDRCAEVLCPDNAESWPDCDCTLGYEGDLVFNV